MLKKTHEEVDASKKSTIPPAPVMSYGRLKAAKEKVDEHYKEIKPEPLPVHIEPERIEMSNSQNQPESQTDSGLNKLKDIIKNFKNSTTQEGNIRDNSERISNPDDKKPEYVNQRYAQNFADERAFSFDEEASDEMPEYEENQYIGREPEHYNGFQPSNTHITIDDQEFEDHDLNQRESPKFEPHKQSEFKGPSGRLSQSVPVQEPLVKQSPRESQVSHVSSKQHYEQYPESNLQAELENLELQKVNRILLSTIESLEKDLHASKRTIERLENENRKLLHSRNDLYQEKEDLVRRYI